MNSEYQTPPHQDPQKLRVKVKKIEVFSSFYVEF